MRPLLDRAVDGSAGAVDVDVGVDVEHEYEYELFVAVLWSIEQPNVDGLVQLGQLPSALDMVHIFCFTKIRKNSMFRFDDKMCQL